MSECKCFVKACEYRQMLTFVDNWPAAIEDGEKDAKAYRLFLQKMALDQGLDESLSRKLAGANLTGANLNGVNLSDANLREANLHGAHLAGSDLTRADLTRADLRDAEFCGEYGPVAIFRDAVLTGAHIPSAEDASCARALVELCGVKGFESIEWGSGMPAGTYVFEVICAMGNDIAHGNWHLYGVDCDEEEVRCAKVNLRRLRLLETLSDENTDPDGLFDVCIEALGKQNSQVRSIVALKDFLEDQGLEVQLVKLTTVQERGLLGLSRWDVQPILVYVQMTDSGSLAWAVRDVHLAHTRVYKDNCVVLTMVNLQEPTSSHENWIIQLETLCAEELRLLVGWVQAHRPSHSCVFLPSESCITINDVTIMHPREHKIIESHVR